MTVNEFIEKVDLIEAQMYIGAYIGETMTLNLFPVQQLGNLDVLSYDVLGMITQECDELLEEHDLVALISQKDYIDLMHRLNNAKL